VFCDCGVSQTMQADFYETPREPGRAYGVYYHLAYWGSGPHLAQGVSPEKIAGVFREIAAKGDTAYAITNVANLRELVPGLEVLSRVYQSVPARDANAWDLTRIPGSLRRLYQNYFENILHLRMGEHVEVLTTRDLHPRTLSDGECRQLAHILLDLRQGKRKDLPEHLYPGNTNTLGEMSAVLAEAARTFETIAGRALPLCDALPPAEAACHRATLAAQALLMRGLYATCAHLANPDLDAECFDRALKEMERLMHDQRRLSLQGPWRTWWRGEAKMGLANLVKAFRNARENHPFHPETTALALETT